MRRDKKTRKKKVTITNEEASEISSNNKNKDRHNYKSIIT
uniref:Uncharacterized protein n=1 Tax=Rhizophora mucronata TaxID=61149 RepID=A0A2P2JZ03_RHIMU